MNPAVCPDCKINPLKCYNGIYNIRCNRCREKYYKEKAKDSQREKREINKKQKENGKCKRCNKEYIKQSINQVFCHSPCTFQRNYIEAFLEKKPPRKQKPYVNEALEYARVKKKFLISKRYTACRG